MLAAKLSSLYPASMQLIDTHCHLDFPEFDLIRSEVLNDAQLSGVTDIIVPGVTAIEWARIKTLVLDHPSLHMALGLHPCFLLQHADSDLSRLEEALAQKTVCAVGEIGLDLFITNANYDRQLYFLQRQLTLALAFDLPVLLHVRKAHDQILKQLRRYKLPKGGIVHAFSGSEQQARQYLELGFKLGVGGTITYDRANKLRRIVSLLPLDSFVLETDAPDMPLSNYRSEVNQPSRVLEVAKTIACLRQCSLEEVAAITTHEALQLFAL